MSMEAELAQEHRIRHNRLWGVPERVQVKKAEEIIIEAPKPPRPILTAAPPFDREITLPPRQETTILKEVMAKHGLTLGEMLSHRRQKNIVQARQEAFYRLAKETSLSLPEMAKRMGGFDHTTALHGIRKHEQRLLAEKLAALDENKGSGENCLEPKPD